MGRTWAQLKFLSVPKDNPEWIRTNGYLLPIYPNFQSSLNSSKWKFLSKAKAYDGNYDYVAPQSVRSPDPITVLPYRAKLFDLANKFEEQRKLFPDSFSVTDHLL